MSAASVTDTLLGFVMDCDRKGMFAADEPLRAAYEASLVLVTTQPPASPLGQLLTHLQDAGVRARVLEGLPRALPVLDGMRAFLTPQHLRDVVYGGVAGQVPPDVAGRLDALLSAPDAAFGGMNTLELDMDNLAMVLTVLMQYRLAVVYLVAHRMDAAGGGTPLRVWVARLARAYEAQVDALLQSLLAGSRPPT